MPRHVRKGDTVVVTSGASKGQVGQIMRVITSDSGDHCVVVKGLNLRTKHIKPSRTSPNGGIITREEPLHISNVSPVVDGKAVRVGFRVKDDGSKVRVARKGGQDVKELSVLRGPTKK